MMFSSYSSSFVQDEHGKRVLPRDVNKWPSAVELDKKDALLRAKVRSKGPQHNLDRDHQRVEWLLSGLHHFLGVHS